MHEAGNRAVVPPSFGREYTRHLGGDTRFEPGSTCSEAAIPIGMTARQKRHHLAARMRTQFHHRTLLMQPPSWGNSDRLEE